MKPIVQEMEAIHDAKDKIVISCDASITQNPGGAASYGCVIRFPGESPLSYSGNTPAATNNEAELDAIYQGVRGYAGLHLHSATGIKTIDIRSDSRICIDLLSGKKKTEIPRLKHKVECILEQVKAVTTITGKNIKFTWRRRNSTADLEKANNAAQDVLGVKNH